MFQDDFARAFEESGADEIILASVFRQSLPDDQRAAIVLVDVEGYGVDETAVILGCPPGTVKSRCSRGRAKLAKQLSAVRNPDGQAGVLPEKQGGGGT